MHGLIHVILKQLVLEKAGPETWQAILDACEVDDDAKILELRQYDDSESFVYVGATAKQLGVGLDVALEVYGTFFVNFVMRNGYKKFMASMGKNLMEFLQNVNEVHYDLERDFRHATFASFTVEPEEGSFLLTYHSGRFLPTLARGSLRGLAEGFFKVQICIDEVARGEKWVTFRITETGPVPEPDPEPVPEAPKRPVSPQAQQTSFGFHTLHTAMASLKCCSSVQACTKSARDARGEAPEVQKVRDSMAEEEALPRHRERRGSNTGGLRVHNLQSRASFKEGESAVMVDMEAFGRAIAVANETERLELARSLLRGVNASRVASTWKTIDEFNKESMSFWDPSTKLMHFFDWSADIFEEDDEVWFVTHSWDKPEGWDELMGTDVAYANGKATELCMTAKDLAGVEFDDYKRWGEVRFWIDKCCIQQGDPKMARMCIDLIEEFLQLSQGLVVLFSWSYLTRLWCVYEWACFLVFHEPEEVIMCCDSFYRAATEGKFLEAVRNFKVENCQCFDQSDRALLERKINTYYYSIQAFERFLKFTIIALLGRSLALRGTRSKLGLKNWAAVARECRFGRLSEALLEVDVEAWQRQVQGTGAKLITQDIHTELKGCCDRWFSQCVAPLFNAERIDCVRFQVLERMQCKKSSMTRACMSMRHSRTGSVDARFSSGVSNMEVVHSIHSTLTGQEFLDKYSLKQQQAHTISL